MKITATVLRLALLVTLAICSLNTGHEMQAQTRFVQATEAAPTLDQILEKYVQALGGNAAFEKLTSRVTVQSVSRPEGEAKVEIYEKAQNQRLSVTTLGGSRKTLTGFDGTTGWAKNPDGEVQEIKDLELMNLKQNSEFYREIKLKELFPQMTLKGKQMIEGRAAYLIEAPTAAGRIEKMYFDARSGLLIRRLQQTVALIRQSDAEEPQAKVIDIVYDYDDYRVVDGVKLPFLIRRRMTSFLSTIKVKEVKHNVALDDELFKKPASTAPVLPKAELPAPTGMNQVGRVSFYWIDETRPETFTADPADHRELMIHVWYPAEAPSGAKPAPYCIGYETFKAGLSNMERQVCETLATHSYANAKPAASQSLYPVLLFSIGNEMAASLYTLLFEELASHGYVVAAIDHPFEAKAVAYPNGRVATYQEGKRPQANSPAFAQEFERSYRLRTDIRAADASFVLTQLEKLNASEQFKGRLDLNRVGIFGHSIGGVAAAQACLLDQRFKAGLNLDGLLRSRPFYMEEKAEGLRQPFMFMGKIPPEPTGQELENVHKVTRQQWNKNQAMLQEQVADVMKAKKGGSYLVWFKDAAHDSFSDGPLISPLVSAEAREANLQRAKLIRAFTLAFFDQYLKEKRSALLSGQPSSDPRVRVEAFQK